MSEVEDPTGTEALEDTEQEEQVDTQVVIDDIEVGVAPVEAEQEGEDGAQAAKDQGDQFAGNLGSLGGVSDHSGGSLNHGEGGVETEGVQSEGQDENPEVGPAEGVNGAGESNEGKTGGADLVGDFGAQVVEVTNSGEHSEAAEERETAVTNGHAESVADNGSLNGVVRGVRGHDTHADTEGEENLTASIRPHGGVGQLRFSVGVGNGSGKLVAPVISVPGGDVAGGIAFDGDFFTLEVHADTLVSILEAKTVEHHDEDENGGHRHGNPDDV